VYVIKGELTNNFRSMVSKAYIDGIETWHSVCFKAGASTKYFRVLEVEHLSRIPVAVHNELSMISNVVLGVRVWIATTSDSVDGSNLALMTKAALRIRSCWRKSARDSVGVDKQTDYKDS